MAGNEVDPDTDAVVVSGWDVEVTGAEAVVDSEEVSATDVVSVEDVVVTGAEAVEETDASVGTVSVVNSENISQG